MAKACKDSRTGKKRMAKACKDSTQEFVIARLNTSKKETRTRARAHTKFVFCCRCPRLPSRRNPKSRPKKKEEIPTVIIVTHS